MSAPRRLKVLIVDDEPPARERLVSLLAEIPEASRWWARRRAAARRSAAPHELAPDVVLLDVRMPGMDGLEAARHLNVLEEPPAVIFTTAYDQYAVEAFEAHAVGYLMKPVRQEQLAAALTRAGRLTRAQLQKLAAARGAAQPYRRAPPRGTAAHPARGGAVLPRRPEVHHRVPRERRGPHRGLAAAARERVRAGVRAHSPQRAGRGAATSSASSATPRASTSCTCAAARRRWR